MAKVIWKYTFSITDGVQVLDIPEGAVIRYVGNQDIKICIWAEVHEEAPKERRYFVVVPTGHPIPIGQPYIGTVQMKSFVWHIYELTPSRLRCTIPFSLKAPVERKP